MNEDPENVVTEELNKYLLSIVGILFIILIALIGILYGGLKDDTNELKENLVMLNSKVDSYQKEQEELSKELIRTESKREEQTNSRIILLNTIERRFEEHSRRLEEVEKKHREREVDDRKRGK